MDAELKALLVALAEGQVKLAEGQGRRDERLGRMESAIAHLAEGQAQTDASLKAFARDTKAAIDHLATATEAALTRLTERIAEFGERVTRGFTNGASSDRQLDDAIHALDARVTQLERKKTGPKKRR